VLVSLLLLNGCVPGPTRTDVPVEDATARQAAPFTDVEIIAACAGRNIEAGDTGRGIVIRLGDVAFESASSNLSPQARKQLRDLSAVLREPRASMRSITVEGHTDSVGSEEYNLDLSTRRASVVKRELVFNQVDSGRIIVRGIGEQQLLVNDINPDGSKNASAQSQNRRIEIIIGPVTDV